MLERLSIPMKLALVIGLMFIPLAVALGLFFRASQTEIARLEKELDALEYLKPIRQLYELIPQHRGTANGFLSGDLTQQDRMLDLRVRVDRQLARAVEVDAALGESLGSRQRFAAMHQAWQQLVLETDGLTPAESFERHTALISDVGNLMRYVANTSELLGDPELDTSYLIETMVVRVLETVENLGQLRGLGNGTAARGQATFDEQIRLSELAARVELDARAIADNLEIIFEANSALGEDLRPLSGSALEGAVSFVQLARRELVQEEDISLRPALYFDSGTETIDRFIQLYDHGMASLGTILGQRLEIRQNNRLIQLGFAAVALFIAMVLGFSIQRVIIRQVAMISQVFAKIGMGDFNARAKVISGDELGELAGNLNRMLDSTVGLIQSQSERDSIQGAIAKLLQEVSGVAEGDLTGEAEVTTEITGAIADSFNYMIQELRRIISDVQSTTRQLTTAATEIQSSTEHLAEGSENQTHQIVNTSTALGEMTSAIQRVSENATMAASVAEQALANAQQGNDAVAKTVHGMNGIRQQVQETAKRIKRLGESSQEIGEIVQLISDIADRTSILALNASIQAAMAGEAGRGFGVVAEEVERLADRSAEATGRIDSLIKTIQSETGEAVAAMEKTTREVVDGSNLAHAAGQSLGEIQTVSSQLADLIARISRSSVQQARGSETVSQSMTDISEITRQTAAGTRQTAVSIRHLAELADRLRDGVAAFKLPRKAA